MLISDSHQFIFVHNYKVAGISIKEALQHVASRPVRRELGWFERQLVRIGIQDTPEDPTHLTALEIRERFPSAWENYFTFGFVRNPWSWQVSLYFYMLETENHFQHNLIESMGGFEEYIEWRVEEDKHLQSEFFCDEEGDLIVDFVGKLESIESDFANICEKIGVHAELPHKNHSDHMDYNYYYNDYTKKLIEKHFSEDIKKFEYEYK